MSFAGLRGSFWKKKGGGDEGVITTNLDAFYSFRQLDGYVGNCIEVERTSDNVTLDIGFVSGYVDTSAIATFCSGTTGKIRTWYEQTGNFFNQQNTTHATQPTIYTGGAVTSFNGKTAALFAANNFLNSVIATNLVSKSLYAVVKVNSFLNVSYLCWNAGGLLLNANLGGVDGFAQIAGNNSIYMSNGQENTNENILSLFGDPDKKILNNNANEVTAAGAYSDLTFRNIARSGTSGGLVGYLKEIMIYGAASNYADKDSIINEINTYYSIY